MEIDKKTIGIFAGAILLRLLFFFAFPHIPDILTNQVEISTPISSFKRLKEGLFLYERGASPYDGGLYHQAPLLLVIFQLFPAPLVFVALDAINAASLKSIARDLRIPSPRFTGINDSMVAAAYLFNPFVILSCLGRSTSIFTNTAIIQAVLSAQSGNIARSMLALALSTYLSVYPILLLPPLIVMMGYTVKSKDSITLTSIGLFFISLALLLGSTLFLTGDVWEFIKSCYGQQITVPDLTPNVGLWWYFFIEIFDSFRDFFIGVFWLHLVGYVGGLTYRLRNQPLFVITTLLGLVAVFKPYPSIADVSIYLAFLPLYKHIIPREYVFPLSCLPTNKNLSYSLYLYCCIGLALFNSSRSNIPLFMDLCWIRKCKLFLCHHSRMESWIDNSYW